MATSREAGRDVVDDPVADQDPPLGHVLEPGEHPQRRRLAAAGRADEHEQLALGDLEREVVDGDRAVEALRHVVEADPGHQLPRLPERVARQREVRRREGRVRERQREQRHQRRGRADER